jgi:hypothetical protein
MQINVTPEQFDTIVNCCYEASSRASSKAADAFLANDTRESEIYHDIADRRHEVAVHLLRHAPVVDGKHRSGLYAIEPDRETLGRAVVDALLAQAERGGPDLRP